MFQSWQWPHDPKSNPRSAQYQALLRHKTAGARRSIRRFPLKDRIAQHTARSGSCEKTRTCGTELNGRTVCPVSFPGFMKKAEPFGPDALLDISSFSDTIDRISTCFRIQAFEPDMCTRQWTDTHVNGLAAVRRCQALAQIETAEEIWEQGTGGKL